MSVGSSTRRQTESVVESATVHAVGIRSVQYAYNEYIPAQVGPSTFA